MYLLYYFDYNDNDEPLLQVLGLFINEKEAKNQITILTQPYINWLEKQERIQEINRNRYFQFFSRHEDAFKGTEWGEKNVGGIIEFFSLNISLKFWENPRYIDMSKVSEKLPELEQIE